MRRFPNLFAASVAMTMLALGCGGATTPTAASPAVVAHGDADPSDASGGGQAGPIAVADDAAFDTTGLPPSPWADAPLAMTEVPAPVLAAWEGSELRDCALLAPRDLGDAGQSARPRVGDFEGGWSVEFDQRGQPGLARNGEYCARCGRSVFGIAGTNLSPADLVEEDSSHDVPAPSFADGSHLAVEVAGENEPVAATIAVNGCVYQVWSFLGEEHVQELVGSLRMVDVDRAPTQVAAR